MGKICCDSKCNGFNHQKETKGQISARRNKTKKTTYYGVLMPSRDAWYSSNLRKESDFSTKNMPLPKNTIMVRVKSIQYLSDMQRCCIYLSEAVCVRSNES